MSKPVSIVVRALQANQGDNFDVYAFFIRGADIVKVADISRLSRDDGDALKGFQRPEIRSHVKGIVEYLNHGNVLFPNAIILAMSPEARFVASRGTKPSRDEGLGRTGTLTIPVYDDGNKVAWIVDGQQRSLALASAEKNDICVPVVAFVSDSLAVQREQFILVNKAKPLPTRLINELLPETTGIVLPRDLTSRKLPSELCGMLNRDPGSPFHGLIRRPSDRAGVHAVIIDSAIIKMIRNSIGNPLGALAPFKEVEGDPANVEAMYRLLVTYWSAVRTVFSDAWGKDPRISRLMHSTGIEAMGLLMDRIFARISTDDYDNRAVEKELLKVAPACRWLAGTWESIGLAWNEIQNTPPHIKRLQEALVRAYTSSGKK